MKQCLFDRRNTINLKIQVMGPVKPMLYSRRETTRIKLHQHGFIENLSATTVGDTEPESFKQWTLALFEAGLTDSEEEVLQIGSRGTFKYH